jgi:phosphopantothenoylcysteine decarboxylase/phosphopantothenate--cysteine ligase
LKPPAAANVERVETAAQMLAALAQRFPHSDVLIMAAAVADVRPKQCANGKLKKDALGEVLPLEKTPDILCELGRIRAHQIVVGFALESLGGDAALAEAARKARDHGCDLVVLNGAGSMGGTDAEEVSFVERNGAHESLGSLPKSALALRLVEWCERKGRSRA